MHNYESRYAENWGTIRRTALRATSDRCVRCLARASEVHHLRYKDWRGAIAGREKPGVDIVPLCKHCHDWAHQDKNWHQDEYDPVLGNHSKAGCMWRLRIDYWLWAIVVKGWRSLLRLIGYRPKPRKRRYARH